MSNKDLNILKTKPNNSFEKLAASKRLALFITEQAKHWMKLRNGTMPEANIINGWIESCEFALEDLRVLL